MKKKKYLKFKLSMPNVGSWNGVWSGAKKNHFIIRSVTGEKAESILDKGSFYYSWGDGWGASVKVTEFIPKNKTLKKKSHEGYILELGNTLKKEIGLSDGFAGYDWMVNSIIERLEIKSSREVEKEGEIDA